jgi:C4-type Zn-finger protein
MSDKMTFNSYWAIIIDPLTASYIQKSKVIQKKSENNKSFKKWKKCTFAANIFST